jgi:L-ascorbate metabolism protein UlaG (beta-lactamase superfamily)
MAIGPDYKDGDIALVDHLVAPETAKSQLDGIGDEDFISWIGHATFLARLDGVTILTDPIFSDRASPVSWAGPKRLFEPGLAIEDLPKLDLVVVSHAHYDHFDLDSLAALPNRDQITAVVPLGLATFLEPLGFGHVVELDWYDQMELPSKTGTFHLTAYPSVHWANRSPFDINKSLWMSYGFSAGGRSVYHSGDTEMHPSLFSEIGEAMNEDHGGCDIGLMSIGAYKPRAMMEGVHVTPEAAFEVGAAVGCQKLVPMHWGTFLLSLEQAQEPIERFEKKAGSQLFRLKIGESTPIDNVLSSNRFAD